MVRKIKISHEQMAKLIPYDSPNGVRHELLSSTVTGTTNSLHPGVASTRFIDLWADLFQNVKTLADLHQWERRIPTFGCSCANFYSTWKASNEPNLVIDLRWKYNLKSAVNAKIGRPNISFSDAQWLYRFCGDRGPVHHVITREDLVRDTKHLTRLIYQRHPNVSGIAGVARSGMGIATDIALTLGVDLYEATTDGCRLLSGGVRRTGTLHGERRVDNGPIVIVDDSTCSGYACEQLKHLNAPFYVVYAGGIGRTKVDGYVVPLELPHYFEWNLLHNGIILQNCAVACDMDGVFCEDCPIECDDDGLKYLDWMQRVQPLYWNIEYEIPMIITARREAYREQTLNWLRRHGIRVAELVMFQGSFADRSQTDVGKWKAEQAKQRDRKLFIESDYRQAKTIAAYHPGCQVISIERPIGQV